MRWIAVPILLLIITNLQAEELRGKVVHVADGDTITVLDADASQRICLQHARDGKSFVIEGPPGTGKSQTIANLIAQSIADGKSVLFVSEKMAALEVVFNRLKQSGLSEFSCAPTRLRHAFSQLLIPSLRRRHRTTTRRSNGSGPPRAGS